MSKLCCEDLEAGIVRWTEASLPSFFLGNPLLLGVHVKHISAPILCCTSVFMLLKNREAAVEATQLHMPASA